MKGILEESFFLRTQVLSSNQLFNLLKFLQAAFKIKFLSRLLQTID